MSRLISLPPTAPVGNVLPEKRPETTPDITSETTSEVRSVDSVDLHLANFVLTWRQVILQVTMRGGGSTFC